MTSLPVSGSGGSSIPIGRRTSSWPPGVTSTCVASGGEVVLLDPLAPPADATEIWARLDASPPTVVVILKPDHIRDIDLFVGRYGARAFGPYLVWRDNIPETRARGDRAWSRAARRPRRPLRRAWPQRDAGLAARAARPRLRRRADRRDGELLVWGTPWHEERTLPALRDLLELPFEHVIVSHGEPVHDRAAYERALELPPWSDAQRPVVREVLVVAEGGAPLPPDRGERAHERAVPTAIPFR